ncbi:complement factor H-like isoform X4 [Carassius auratus]|uniref:Complement factor H-like isoform X4 n=1 Tax=Carassius auratus TaxID=7957 RepID=A0A6P6M795_CARAU|nr:complement factor H-like isoform X4 [Carassius auratus]
MRVPVKLLAFGFWLLSLNFAQCQECLRGDIKYADIVPAEKASYADGETVKVICVTGYTGLYKLKCEKGEWKNTIERPCAKKKCSHPGDTPNGDFKLTEGTEFVFGATVVYTCKKGYEMASRINQRTCRAQGWDNAVPVCEVVKCPAIRTDEGVTVLGNAEEGSYGDIIRFECVSSDKMINGSSEIHCDETGKWSDVAPKCKDITCTAPTIPNGSVVDSQREYKKDATLKYKCKETFKPREGIPKCAKFGWTVKPECDEITCELKSTTAGVKKINPDGKIIFRARESVEITCSEKHWFFFTKETRKTFTCKDDGKWDNEPVCAEITCDDPRDRLVSKPYYWGTMKFGEKQSYTCVNGYRGTEAEATCTRDGWTPNPLCTEILCDVPKIKNAKIVGRQRSNYRINSKEEYRCLSGFKPEKPVQITCDSQGQWKDIQQCIEITCELKSTTTGVKKINPDGKIIFRAGESVEITCSEKHWFFFTKESRKTFTCKDDGKWDYEPVCAEITCDDPRDQHVYRPYFWRTMKLEDKQSYSCDYGYRQTEAEATCTRDGWTPKPLCTEIVCAAPNIPNAQIVGLQRSNYKIDSSIRYKCSSGFEPEEAFQITCDREGQWRDIQQCTKMCATPNITNAEIVGRQRSYYKIDSRIRYKCSSGFEPEESVEITCDREGQWRDIRQCTKMCAAPNIKNAEIVGRQRPYYGIYSSIQYECRSGFEPEEPFHITCDREGQWRGIQQCTEMSKLCRKSFLENGFIHIDPSNKEEVFYSCIPGYKLFTGNWWDSVTCRKGSQFEEPRCIREEECGALPSVHHGKLTLRDPETADVKCDPGFMSTNRSIKCTNGRWEKPVCKVHYFFSEAVRCGIPPNVPNAIITSKPEEFYNDGSNLTYVCRSSYSIRGEDKVSCRNGTWEKTPTCQEVTCELNSTTFGVKKIIPRGKTTFRAGEIVEITCSEKYWFFGTKETKKKFTCKDNGEWDNEPVCAEVTCPLQRITTEDFKIERDPDIEGPARPRHTIYFSCTGKDMILKGQREITCQSNGEWSSPFPTCEGEHREKVTCPLQRITTEDFKIERDPDIEGPARPRHTIYFSCAGQDMILKGQREITCQSNGEWSSPFPTCEEVTCPLQRITTEDFKIERDPDIEGPARPGHTIYFSCTGKDMILKGQREITCQSNGEWSSPFPTCEGEHRESQTTSCRPPPDVNDADTIELKKDEYTTGERVEYSCFSKYTLDLRPPFSRFLTCDQGEWRGNIKCLKPCTVTVEEMERRGIALAYVNRQKMFAPNNDNITFACKRGKYSVGVPLRQQCNDGVMTLPECE